MAVAGHVEPQIENELDNELVLRPITICRTSSERCKIEASINSVRVSVRFKQESADPIDQVICQNLMRFLMQQNDALTQFVIRRVPIEGYSVSLLIQHGTTSERRVSKDALIEFVVGFIEDADREISEMKITTNARARAAATSFLKSI